MKKVQFQFAVFNEVRTQTRDYKVLGTAMTDDSGRFYFEYPCLNDNYKHGYIYIYSLAPNGGIRKVEDFSKDLKTELFYSTVGKAQVVLKPKKHWEVIHCFCVCKIILENIRILIHS
jgi:hypothetical protein